MIIIIVLFPTFLEKKNLGIQNNYFSFNVCFIFVCWKYCKVPLHLQLLVKWEVVSPNSRYREFYHEIGNIEKFPGGGGGCNVFLAFCAISNISRKKNLGIQNNYFSFNVFFVVFLYAGNIVKCPFTYSYWSNGRWFLKIVDIGNFIMRLEILKSSPSLTG